MPKWISFIPAPPPPSGKTKAWTVATKDGITVLGFVKWYPSWRCYGFFPMPATVYEHQCLRDIAEFLEAETKAHREKLKRAKETVACA